MGNPAGEGNTPTGTVMEDGMDFRDGGDSLENVNDSGSGGTQLGPVQLVDNTPTESVSLSTRHRRWCQMKKCLASMRWNGR